MDSISLLIVVVVYLASVRVIGLPLAMLAWKTWNNIDDSSWRAWLLFPVNTFFETIGEDSFSFSLLAHPFLPIVCFHGAYSGTGFGEIKKRPRAKIFYFCLIASFWPVKALSCVVGLVAVGVCFVVKGFYLVGCAFCCMMTGVLWRRLNDGHIESHH